MKTWWWYESTEIVMTGYSNIIEQEKGDNVKMDVEWPERDRQAPMTIKRERDEERKKTILGKWK